VPHVVAFALAMAAGGVGARTIRDVVGSGFLGATRLAASDPEMTAGFLAANAAATRESLDRFREAVDRLDASLEVPEELEPLLAEARSARMGLIGTEPPASGRAPGSR